MRLSRKLMLLAVTAVAAMAFSVASASAATVKVEATGATCGSVTDNGSHEVGSGGCIIHATSNGTVELGWFGSMITCNNEFEGRTDGSGKGFIYDIVLSSCSGSVVPCNEGGDNDNWPSQLNSATSQEASFCVIAFGVTINCTIENLTVTENSKGSHAATTIATPNGSNHTDCDEFNGATLSGSWTAENDATHPELEIT